MQASAIRIALRAIFILLAVRIMSGFRIVHSHSCCAAPLAVQAIHFGKLFGSFRFSPVTSMQRGACDRTSVTFFGKWM
jgi:hypothetical protein